MKEVVQSAELGGRAERSGIEDQCVGPHVGPELRTFERDYRAQLKSYIQGQLSELDSSGEQSGLTPAPASAQGFGN